MILKQLGKSQMIPSLHGRWVFLAGITSLLLLWSLASLLINSSLLLPSPWVVITKTAHLLLERETYTHITASCLRIGGGIFTSGLLGILIGLLCGKYPLIFRFFQPWLTLSQSVPAIVWVLLALLWLPRDVTPIFLVFLTTFPLWVLSLRQSLLAIPKELLEMADIFAMKGWRKWWSIFFPSILLHITTSLRATISLSIKIVIMAEILAFPTHGIGNRLFWAKTYVNIEELFAWASLLLLLGWILDELLSLLFNQMKKQFFLEVS